MRKEPTLEPKKSQPKKEQLQEIPSGPEHLPLSPFSSSRVEGQTCSLFADVSLTGNAGFDVSETQESKTIFNNTTASWTNINRYSRVPRSLGSQNSTSKGGGKIFWNVIDDFTVSGEMPLLKFPCGGCNLNFGSAKFYENP